MKSSQQCFRRFLSCRRWKITSTSERNYTIDRPWSSALVQYSRQCSNSISGGAATNLSGGASTPLANSVPATSLSNEELEQITTLLENDPRILMEVVNNLDPENRRRLVVAGGAMEWFGAESAAQEVERADVDKDRQISPKDFDHWFENALKRKIDAQKKKIGDGDGTVAGNTPIDSQTQQPIATSNPSSDISVDRGSHATSTTANTAPVGAAAPGSAPPFSTLVLIAVEAGLPFVGFGFLDNAAMILAGDAIDGTVGFYLNLSVLASAAMGNVCSGLLGMQVHGLIEKAVRRVLPFTPVLSEEHMKHPRVFMAGHIGGTIGIMIGLFLGMLPLLFLDTENSDTEKSDYAIFQKWDHNSSGSIELTEFEKCLNELGLKDAHDRAKDLLQKYGDGKQLNFEEFGKLRADLREGRQIF